MKTIKRYEIHTRRVQLSEDMAPYNRHIHSSPDTMAIAKSLIGHYDEEYMIVFMLDGKLRINGYAEVAKGGTGSVEVSIPNVFRPAIYTGSSSIILSHNHPSGDSTPSRDDVTFTNKVYEAAKFVGIRLLDHIIVGDDCFSFLDAGLMPGTAP